MTSMGTTPTQIRIPADLKAQVRELAAQRRETLSSVVIRALKEYVSQAHQMPESDDGLLSDNTVTA